MYKYSAYYRDEIPAGNVVMSTYNQTLSRYKVVQECLLDSAVAKRILITYLIQPYDTCRPFNEDYAPDGASR